MRKLQAAGDLIFERLEHDTSDYLVDGERVVSVTEALRIAGLVDFSDIPVSRLEQAAERGTIVHAAIAALEGGTGAEVGPFAPDWIDPYIHAFERFKADTGFQARLVERAVVCKRFRFAGRLDLAGDLNDHPALIDIKTSQTIPPWVALQTMGYQLGLEEHVREHVEDDGLRAFPRFWLDEQPGKWPGMRRYALRLLPDGKYTLYRFTDAGDRADFLAVLRVAAWQLRYGGWVLDH